MLRGEPSMGLGGKFDVSRSDPSFKKRWAYIQHPMWLVIREDPGSAEATPPWGAATTDEYAERVGRNLAIVENNRGVKLNYEFGAYELEDLVKKHPDLYERMRRMVEAGRLFFVNGTYNQPHGQALSLEGNIRQLEHGLAVYKELFGVDVKTHALQEPDYTNQTPQILKAFGLEFAACGGFFHDLITPMGAGPEPSLMYRWVGLDGTEIALAIDQNGQGAHFDRRTAPEPMRHPKFVHFAIPDMDEFDVRPDREYVALDEALQEQYQECPPAVEARLQLPWSYIEGTDGESLMQAVGRCEESLIRAETLSALKGNRSADHELSTLWRGWLQAQHHDALWHGAPGLREASLRWCRDAQVEAEQVSRTILSSTQGGGWDIPALRLVSTYPVPHRGVVRIPWRGELPERLRDEEGRTLPVQVGAAPGSNDASEILVPYESMGIERAVFLAEGRQPGAGDGEPLTESFAFKNAHYQAEISAYGGVVRAYSNEGRELFRNTATRTYASTTDALRKFSRGEDVPRPGIGRGWTATDETHFRYGVDALGALTVVQDGKMCAYALSKYTSRLVKGPVADIVTSFGQVGNIPVSRRTYLYHELPWIEMEITCHFDETVIDEYLEDANKLCVWWPYFYRDLIQNGIPGGSEAPSRPEIGFLPVNWFDVDHQDSGNGGGYAVAFPNTFKTFRRAGRLGTVLAWGDDQGHFTNRNEELRWRNVQDLRLRGERTYRFFVHFHDRDWRAAGIPDWAFVLQRTPLADQVTASAASRESWLALDCDGLIPTSVRRDRDAIKVRFYESLGCGGKVSDLKLFGKRVEFTVTDLQGAAMPEIGPFKIGEINLKG